LVKVKNQSAILKYFAKYRRKTNVEVAKKFNCVAKELEEISLAIVQLDPGLADIRHIAMGYEGRAAAMYWRTVKELIPDSNGILQPDHKRCH